jgi:Fe2+ or Zn2+ uptake regulation protein
MANVNRYKRDILEICEKWHRTAEEIHKKIKKYNLFVWVGTIYRNLTELVHEWKLIKHHGIGDKLLYEITKPPHWHLFCQNSWMIEDIDISMIDFTWIIVPENFSMDEIQLTIAGHFNDSDSRDCKINWRILKR